MSGLACAAGLGQLFLQGYLFDIAEKLGGVQQHFDLFGALQESRFEYRG